MCQFNYNIFHFQIFHKIWNGTPVFWSLLDLVSAVLVFAVFSWNVTPANNEGRLYTVRVWRVHIMGRKVQAALTSHGGCALQLANIKKGLNSNQDLRN